MNKIGFIGFGSMGSMLAKGLIESGSVKLQEIIITRKDKSRLGEIKAVWPEIGITQEAIEVVKKADYIFICVKPLEYKNILNEIKPYISPYHHIISLAESVTMRDMEKLVACKITKLMPTVISEIKEGISLVCHNSRVTDEDVSRIESLLGSISKLQRIDEKDFGFASELTSCGPGLIAAIFKELAEAGIRHTDCLKEEDIIDMIIQTVYGTVGLMIEKNMDFGDIISRVATKGGITEEGVKVIEKGFPKVFDEMFDQTMNKRNVINEEVSKGFMDI